MNLSRGHIDGFKNIPVDELKERINEIEKESLCLRYARVVCAVILRAVFWKETAMKRIISLADFASMMQWLMTVR